MRKSTKPIPWNDNLDESFITLKAHVCEAPSLLLLDPSKPFTFESKKFSPTLCWYVIQDKVQFAIIHALKHVDITCMGIVLW